MGRLVNGEETGTCAYNHSMEYTPIQLELHRNIASLYGNAKYLLQVWNKKGTKVLQIELQSNVHSWAICFQYFIFKTQAPDKHSEYYQIYDLERSIGRSYCVTYVSADWIDSEEKISGKKFKYLLYNNNKLFVANEDCIKVVGLKLNTVPGED